MDRKVLVYIGIAVSMLYGASFALFDDTPTWYAVLGGAVVALVWIAVGMFGRDTPDQARSDADRTI